ncbi:MAG: hypothetical protein RLZZ169_1237 [Pseudomonadota bacterium]|jgi:IclR family pca regulon transcriptional regulator
MKNTLSRTFEESNREHVASLAKGLAVIRCFDQQHRQMTLSEVAKLTELTRATARRFLHTLHELGYMDTDGKLFWLTPKVLDLGYSYLVSQPLIERVQPYTKELCDAIGESCSVSVLDFPDVVYVARTLSHQIMSVSLNVGARLPAVTTSMGRVLLAAKDDGEIDDLLGKVTVERFTKYTLVEPSQIKNEIQSARKRGYAICNQELEIGLRSLAVPIRNRQGKAVAAINVSSQPLKVSETKLLREILPQLREAARKISDAL